MAATVDELAIADAPASWEALGFRAEDDACVVGEVRLRLAGEEAGRGLLGWSLRGVEATELDGLPTETSSRPSLTAAQPHPNGIAALDHLVAISPDLDRTVPALQAAGLDLRLLREEPTPAGAPRQAFFRLGATILEVVQEPDEVLARKGVDRPAFFWGLAFLVPDLDATVAHLGDSVSEIRPAVQPGRRIATLRREAGLACPVALISPRPAS
jgi:hypothetical protein